MSEIAPQKETGNLFWIGKRHGRWLVHCRKCNTFEEALSLREAFHTAKVHNQWFNGGILTERER